MFTTHTTKYRRFFALLTLTITSILTFLTVETIHSTTAYAANACSGILAEGTLKATTNPGGASGIAAAYYQGAFTNPDGTFNEGHPPLPTSSPNIGSWSVKVTVPDTAATGDTYTVSLTPPLNFSTFPKTVTAPDGSVIATAQATQFFTTRQPSTLTFTYTNYVATHSGVSFPQVE